MDYKIDFIEKHDDKRGHLVVFLRDSDLKKEFKEFGQIYFVTFGKSNVVRGNHYHKKWREWFGLVTGKVEVVLKDMKTGEIVRIIIDSKSDKYTRLEIGPNIAHSFRNLSKKASLLNYTDTEWSPDDTFFEELIK
ncbi:MAG: WxcM-like domain-containing protein [Candidatus Shapirobacteria bacterium]|jgi:dTDP-4-dehydrorhamnose 3,5-epimerase-like enzyme